MLRRLLNWIGNPPVAVVYADEVIEPPGGTAVARVTIRDRATFWKVAFDPEYEFGEGYAAGTIEVEGDLVELLKMVSRTLNQPSRQQSLIARLIKFLRRPNPTNLAKSRDNISHHYDIGNDFYKLWLDEQLVYTCAYFPERTASLEAAQLAKMDHICRKLRLRPGQAVLEAGCGWGSFAIYMAQQYGVKVKAFNISQEQIAYARAEAKRQGLEDQVEFIQDDWRNMNQPCDVFVSVGMLEHVGLENYAQLGEVIHQCLKPDGMGLIHSIGQNHFMRLNPWIERRIFPGAQPPALRQMMELFEPHDLSVLDVENLRLHYALTLRHWLERFEQVTDQVREMFDQRFERMWRLYLSGSIAGFETGGLQLFQVLFSRGTNNEIPWTREDIYRRSELAETNAART